VRNEKTKKTGTKKKASDTKTGTGTKNDEKCEDE
jgi:hypothetical protein